MLNATVAAALPKVMGDAGEKVAVAPAGRPVTANVIGSVRVVPVTGVSMRLKLAVAPAATLMLLFAADSVKGRTTMKLVVAVAAVKFPLAAWLAVRTTDPVPVSVTMLPAIVAGPLMTA